MNHNYFDNDYSDYEALFDPMQRDRKARRKRKPKAKHTPKKDAGQILRELADEAEGLEAGFQTTYQPGLFEESWLLQSLRGFYDQALITDVLGRVKGGKEASVYRCAAHPSTNERFLAAKVYRPQMFRNLRNDAMYREGRAILTEDGREVKKTDHRVLRAVGKKSGFGQQVAHTSWLMYEFTTLQRLHAAGADVPRPIVAGENAILMTYIGDEKRGAPTLSEVALDETEAQPLFEALLRNIEILLRQGYVHGDLSAYNILYWEGALTLIDFPQVIHIKANQNAHAILQRDIERICAYFERYGVICDAHALTAQFWRQYGPQA